MAENSCLLFGELGPTRVYILAVTYSGPHINLADRNTMPNEWFYPHDELLKYDDSAPVLI